MSNQGNQGNQEMNDNVFLMFGPPGCGKTTYLKHQVERAAAKYGDSSVLVCSFTRGAAAEIGSRVNLPKRNVGTLHSICFHALDCPEMTEGKEDDFNERNPDLLVTVRRKRGDHADDPFDTSADGTRGDAIREELDMLRVRRIPPEKWPSYVMPFFHCWTKWKEETGRCDFTDLLEKCLADFHVAPNMPSAIFFDEAQDASQLQADLLAQWGEHAQRLILAGDDDQAIFFWAGADYRSFLDFPCATGKRRYLQQSYRVPRAVHAIAERWIKTLDRREEKIYKSRDEDGYLERSSATWKQPEAAVNMAEQLVAAGKTVMFEAACSYMLEPVKAILRQRGLPFHNPWRRTRGDWNPLAPGGAERTMPVDRLRSFLRPSAAMWGEDASFWQRHDLWAWASLLEAKGNLVHGAKERLKEMKQNFSPSCVEELFFLFQHHLMDGINDLRFASDAEAVSAVDWWLDSLPEKEAKKLHYPRRVFEACGAGGIKETPKIVIGTGHSLKGAEADVCFVFPDLSRAGWDSWSQDVDGREGIIRLFYVMLTRAREGLVLCQPALSLHVDLMAA